jgi:glycosyltransferase involved in cell wall biosynthesis
VSESIFALSGRRDEPTDAVEEYCKYLGAALAAHDLQMEIRRVPWDSRGWASSLEALRLMAASWRGRWVLVQYTALAWSARGFPGKFERVLYTLAKTGARIGVVYHDVEPYPGDRLVDHARRFVQVRTMRSALRFADVAIFTVPLEKISWIAGSPDNAHFIPVGPNLPIAGSPLRAEQQNDTQCVAVFSVTGGEPGLSETRAIAAAIRHAAEKIGKFRLSVFGRNADSAEALLRDALRGLSVEISVEGVLEESQLVERLTAADVLLFVRGQISSRRSSAIAGIACGLPVIAYAGSETAPPITDAGVVLVSQQNQDELNATLLRVLSDSAYRSALAAKSRAAFTAHFSWASIAARYASILK